MKKLISCFLLLCSVIGFSGCDEVVNIETDNITVEAQATQKAEKDYEPTPTMTVTPTLEPEPVSNELSEDMRVHFIDVGQADSTFIELADGQTLLIDAGRSVDGSKVVSYIQSLEYEDIDYVVATHPHDDHIGGMATVLENFDIGKVYMPRQAHNISAFENMLDVIEEKDIELYTAKAGVNMLASGDIVLDILSPMADNYSNLNNCSAVVKITYGETVMLFTGDAEQEIETQLLGSDIDADVLKVGHHGAGSSSAPSFIRAVSPEVAVISCGEDNSYGHPHKDTLAILNDVNADIYRTDEQGTIIVTADSNKKISVDKKASAIKENAPPVVINVDSTEENESISEVGTNNSETVYRTRTGKKYHKENCSYLKSKIETTVIEATAMGLEPCSRCFGR